VYSSVRTNSASWNSVYSSTRDNSANWNSVYSNVNSNSANYALTNKDVTFLQNVTIVGGLTALSGATFTNTIFTTTSALSVVNVGGGPALFVYQAAGPYDVASFYDGDGVEVLHVGNAAGGGNPKGKVGINESDPAKELTVNGAISANQEITVLGGNSNQWNSVYSDVNATSAARDSVYSNVNTNSASWGGAFIGPIYTTVNTNSASWNSNYTTTNTLSTGWAYRSGDTITEVFDISVFAAGGYTTTTSSTLSERAFFIGDWGNTSKWRKSGCTNNGYPTITFYVVGRTSNVLSEAHFDLFNLTTSLRTTNSFLSTNSTTNWQLLSATIAQAALPSTPTVMALRSARIGTTGNCELAAAAIHLTWTVG